MREIRLILFKIFSAPEDKMNNSKIQDLFEACDHRKRGYIEKAELQRLCCNLHLSQQEFDELFNELDRDGDGRVSRIEFITGFQEVTELFSNNNTNHNNQVMTRSTSSDSGIVINPSGPESKLSPSGAWAKFLTEHHHSVTRQFGWLLRSPALGQIPAGCA